MKATRYGGWFAGILTAAMLLSGCSGPASVAERVERGLPTSWTEAQRSAIPWETTSAAWLEDGSRFALITWGSSSCPAVVTSLEAIAADGIELRLEPSGGSGPCSADMAATTHELALPESVTGRPVILTLRYPEGAPAETLVLH